MAMDIVLFLHVTFLTSFIAPCCGMDVYMCSWPASKVIQLKCDYVNCPYLSVDRITVGRLHGNPASCTEFNSNETLRKPITSCDYQLLESHDFFGQVKNNCSRKQVCEISSEEVFRSAGICGREIGEPDSIRNWIHVEHSCYGDIPGVKCTAVIPKLPTTTSPQPTSSLTGLIARARRPVTRAPNQNTITNSSQNSGVDLIIPILATLLFCTLFLIVATMLYRHGVCHRKPWKRTIQSRLNQHQLDTKAAPAAKLQKQLNHPQLKIDSSRLKELEKRLNRNQAARSNSNEYFHDFSFSNTALPRITQKVQALDDVKMRSASRRGRRGSLDISSYTTPSFPPLPTTEMYFSDTSESTTATEHDFDSNGRRKRRRVKPLPPLPRPIVSHSEVYFTETETESEAATRPSKRKEPLPKLDPPPKVARDKTRHDRLRVHRPGHHSLDALNNNHGRQSLELALTKGAAKKLNTPTVTHDYKTHVRVVCRKPTARPRAPRTSTSLYGNILLDEKTMSLTNTMSTNNNIPRRSNTIALHGGSNRHSPNR